MRGDGAYIHTADGRRIIDAISSWSVVTHGHCHPPIVRAIQEQAGTLDQIIFAAGVDINTIRAWLGHVSLDATHVYAEVDLEMKAEALARVDISSLRPPPRQPSPLSLMAFLKTL